MAFHNKIYSILIIYIIVAFASAISSSGYRLERLPSIVAAAYSQKTHCSSGSPGSLATQISAVAEARYHCTAVGEDPETGRTGWFTSAGEKAVGRTITMAPV